MSNLQKKNTKNYQENHYLYLILSVLVCVIAVYFYEPELKQKVKMSIGATTKTFNKRIIIQRKLL